MRADDREVFHQLMMALCSTFRVDPTEALFEGYWIGMSAITIDDFRESVQWALSHCEFMPKPVELRSTCDVDHKSCAVLAWQETLQLARDSRGDHSDPIAREVIELMGGGRALGAMDEHELTVWGRKQFEQYYLDVAERHERTDRLLSRAEFRLIGNGCDGE